MTLVIASALDCTSTAKYFDFFIGGQKRNFFASMDPIYSQILTYIR